MVRMRKLRLNKKYTLEDLALHLKEQTERERDWRVKTFDQLYQHMEEMKVFELKPTSSIADPQSPRGSESVASITPSSAYGGGGARGFFKD